MTNSDELWSASQAAEYLGVTRQRIDQLSRAYAAQLPQMPRKPGLPRYWLARDWREFAQMERPNGRPRYARRDAS